MAVSSLFDSLICQEELTLEEDEQQQRDELYHQNSNFTNDELVSDSSEFLSSLMHNEQQTHHFVSVSNPTNNPYLNSARKEAVGWVKSASSRFGFNALTVILAVNYLDRCFLSSSSGLSLQSDKPWMKQLSTVACLSLAAKVEETQVPLLLDLQLGNEREGGVGFYVFESKAVKRMELLVLSTLGWRMSPVTALSFIQCILARLLVMRSENGGEILSRCENVLLSVLQDWRWVQFPPCIWAAAAILHSMQQHLDVIQQVLELLHVTKERVEECIGVIEEVIGGNKRKRPPQSPNGVIESYFSYESSSSLDSWHTMWASVSVSSSPEPPFKRHHI